MEEAAAAAVGGKRGQLSDSQIMLHISDSSPRLSKVYSERDPSATHHISMQEYSAAYVIYLGPKTVMARRVTACPVMACMIMADTVMVNPAAALIQGAFV